MGNWPSVCCNIHHRSIQLLFIKWPIDIVGPQHWLYISNIFCKQIIYNSIKRVIKSSQGPLKGRYYYQVSMGPLDRSLRITNYQWRREPPLCVIDHVHVMRICVLGRTLMPLWRWECSTIWSHPSGLECSLLCVIIWTHLSEHGKAFQWWSW